MIGKFGDPLRQHRVQRAALIVLEVPILCHDMAEEPVKLRLVGDQLGEEKPQIPLDDHTADIEYNGLNWSKRHPLSYSTYRLHHNKRPLMPRRKRS